MYCPECFAIASRRAVAAVVIIVVTAAGARLLAQETTHPFIDEAKLITSDGAFEDFVGGGVISGDLAVLATGYGWDPSVYVFARATVAIDGDVAVVGAPGGQVINSYAPGAVYVFERNEGGPNAWGHNRPAIPYYVSFPADSSRCRVHLRA
jgi:hypothetical protein